MAEQNTDAAEWQAEGQDTEQGQGITPAAPGSPEQSAGETPDPNETPGQGQDDEQDSPEVAELKQQLAESRALNAVHAWEGAYREAFEQSGLPDTADEIVRGLLDGATPEQVGPTIEKLAQFAQATQPAPVASQRPVESMTPGTGRPRDNGGATGWSRDLLNSN
ncbi:hypothetical protein [Corynebacterium halotolerans]|uniref:hypothetical protein n=1 Tax=Corynebacterium halotolerans TaxID=225326 RepID=UPI003CF9F472